MVSRKENAWRKKLLSRKKKAKPSNTLKSKSPISKQKKQKKNKKAFKPFVPKEKAIPKHEENEECMKEEGIEKHEENEKLENELIEFYGQRIMPADKEKMEAIIPSLKSHAERADLENFVANFSSFESMGTLVFKRYKKVQCRLCQKKGHRLEICPKRWKDGQWMELSAMNIDPSLLQAPKSKSKKVNTRCLNCNQQGHDFIECPEFAEVFEDLEEQD